MTLRWPAAHVLHDVLPVALAYFPRGHAKHAASDAFVAPKEPYRPTAHDVPLAPMLVHASRTPGTEACVPAGHRVQSAAHTQILSALHDTVPEPLPSALYVRYSAPLL